MLNRWVENIAAAKFENDAKLPLKSAQQQQNEHLRRGLAKVKIGARNSKNKSSPNSGKRCPDFEDEAGIVVRRRRVHDTVGSPDHGDKWSRLVEA